MSTLDRLKPLPLRGLFWRARARARDTRPAAVACGGLPVTCHETPVWSVSSRMQAAAGIGWVRPTRSDMAEIAKDRSTARMESLVQVASQSDNV